MTELWFQLRTTSQPETLVRIKAGSLVTPAMLTGKSDQSHAEGLVLFPGCPGLFGCKE